MWIILQLLPISTSRLASISDTSYTERTCRKKRSLHERIEEIENLRSVIAPQSKWHRLPWRVYYALSTTPEGQLHESMRVFPFATMHSSNCGRKEIVRTGAVFFLDLFHFDAPCLVTKCMIYSTNGNCSPYFRSDVGPAPWTSGGGGTTNGYSSSERISFASDWNKQMWKKKCQHVLVVTFTSVRSFSVVLYLETWYSLSAASAAAALA